MKYFSVKLLKKFKRADFVGKSTWSLVSVSMCNSFIYLIHLTHAAARLDKAKTKTFCLFKYLIEY